MTRSTPGSAFFSPDHESCDPVQPGRRSWRGRRLVLVGAALALGAGALSGAVSPACADPSANSWYRLRMCESSNNYKINTGNGYYGAYQFNLGTWQSVGGHGYPNQASPAEQDARALILYRERGWQPWTCAGIVGLREDGDARSGRTSDIKIGSSSGSGSSSSGSGSSGTPTTGTTGGVPAWPNSKYWSLGDRSPVIAQWQQRMHSRGSRINTDGVFSPLTLQVVNAIQRFNGLPATGLLGPVTWRLAWTGRYAGSKPVTSKPVTTKPVTTRPVTTGPTGAAPAWPGTQYWNEGDHSSTIARWQAQMHRRGSRIVGTGDFGPVTLTVVKRIQAVNGLRPTGLLGPVTWKLAWTGKYY